MSKQDLAPSCLVADGKYAKNLTKGAYLWLECNVSGEKVEAVVTNCSPKLLTFVIIESGDVYTMTPDLFIDTFFVVGFKIKVSEKDYGSYVKNAVEKTAENVVSTVNEIKDQLTSPECKAKAKEAGEKAKEAGAKVVTTTANVLNSVFTKLNGAVQNVKSTMAETSETEDAETEDAVASTTDNNVVAEAEQEGVEEVKEDVAPTPTPTAKDIIEGVGETKGVTAFCEEGEEQLPEEQFHQLSLDAALIEGATNALVNACNSARQDNSGEAIEKLIAALEGVKEKLEARK